ncbi:hypothetical protein [Thermosynechococcus sp.]|uniref:hypothetical protein n=1 Tax=Thermosynechococcus sp. TaxID=2814275 RepID=UPI00391D3323
MPRRGWTTLLLLPLLAQNPNLPQANRHGDYPLRTDHRLWVVVDSDRQGLNCRWSPQVPKAWYSPLAKWPRTDIWYWPVVRRFPRGTVLKANLAPSGFAMIPDDRGLPWLKVTLGKDNRICLVRANRHFIRPR